MEKHCCTRALVGADFKAADADKADATARLFPSSSPSPPPLPSSLLAAAAAAAAAALPVSLPRKQTQSGKLNI